MKTAKEWAIERNEMDLYYMQAASNDECMAEFAMFLQQIQLDAMKEGMRRAAKICNQYQLPPRIESIKAIELASSQLTIKDLEV